MRVMVLVKATKDSEAGIMPSTELLEAMGKYNEELAKAGIMLAGEGLHEQSIGVLGLGGRGRQHHQEGSEYCPAHANGVHAFPFPLSLIHFRSWFRTGYIASASAFDQFSRGWSTRSRVLPFDASVAVRREWNRASPRNW